MGEYREQIKTFFEENFPQFTLTKTLYNLLEEHLESFLNEVSLNDVFELWSNDNMVKFIENRQPNISQVEENVQANITEYFDEFLPDYRPVLICRSSNHHEDSGLYSVVAENKKNNTIACWTSWNENTQSLNSGHYNLATMEDAEEIIRENFYDITMEMDKYGPEQSYVKFEVSNLNEEENKVIDFNEYKNR